MQPSLERRSTVPLALNLIDFLQTFDFCKVSNMEFFIYIDGCLSLVDLLLQAPHATQWIGLLYSTTQVSATLIKINKN